MSGLHLLRTGLKPLCIIQQLVELGSPKKHTATQQTYVNPALVQINEKVTKLTDKVELQEDKLVYKLS